MKIEIDNEVLVLKQKNKFLSEKIDSLDEKNLIKEYERKAWNAAINLSNNFLDLIFTKLGFDKSVGYHDTPLILDSNLQRVFEPHWWVSGERVNVTISAKVINDWKKLTVSLGLISKEDLPKVKSILELE